MTPAQQEQIALVKANLHRGVSLADQQAAGAPAAAVEAVKGAQESKKAALPGVTYKLRLQAPSEAKISQGGEI